MKLKTNLSSRELELVAKGLTKLAKSQTDGPYVPQSPAEEELLEDVTRSVELSLDRLGVEISSLFTEE